MLTELRVRNFAIIENLTLPLGGGLNVLSGETGAGKSIIVGALGLLLGERASSDLVRTGAERASVEGVFDIATLPEVAAVLDARGIDLDNQTVVLKREVTAAGRARAWINGTTVTATVLADVGRVLVNLHGQHEAQALLDGESQRDILDDFGGARDLVAAVRAAHDDTVAVRRSIAELTARKRDAERRADYLRHVATEVGDARLIEGEDARLDEEARRLEHAEELRSLAAGITDTLSDADENVLHRLGTVQKSLAALQHIDPSVERLQQVFDAAFYALEELSRELSAYAQSVDLDPARLAEVEARRDLLFRLMKKYGVTIAEVMETGARARAELDLVDTAGLDLRQLEERERAAAARLAEAADALSQARRQAARRLARAVDAVLPDLGMADGHFTAELVPRDEVGERGAEDVEFRVALNVGHDARALARVASGGELSRVMLALKTILARLDRVPTLVFDEVDAGIGGRVGLLVGETMRGVAGHHQVLAISHLPQIAARAHHHIVVSKAARGGVTTADVRVVQGGERVTEIARMLGGDPESDASRAHARELLEHAAPPPADAPVGTSRAPTRAPRREPRSRP
jgi:DNA repair protein RecN (Recombination protein N)